MSKTASSLRLIASLIFVVSTKITFSLTCSNVSDIKRYYLQSHYSVNRLSSELSARTLDNFIKAWDPGKIFFLKQDIDKFKQKYGQKFAYLAADKDCGAIEDIFKTFSERFEQRYALIPKLIDTEHNFTIDENIDLDRKRIEWVSLQDQLNERWRKRVKFQFLQLANSLRDTEEAFGEKPVKAKLRGIVAKRRKAKRDLKVREKLHKRYKLSAKRQRELEAKDILEAYLNCFAKALDPHSSHMPTSQLEQFQIDNRLSLEGIGAILRSEDGFTKVQSLVVGGAAYRKKELKPEDIIIGVAQGNGVPVNVIDMDLQDVVRLIRGPRGTEVRLTVKRKTKTHVISIIREEIRIPDRAAKSKVFSLQRATQQKSVRQKSKVGVIELPSFYMDMGARQARRENYTSSSRDVRAEILKLQEHSVDAIVLDLRSNPGGILEEAVNIAGLFAGPGPMVQQKDSRSRTYASTYSLKRIYQGPLVVMIDRHSASASEILAGAIKDYQRGIIVGSQHTFGKGTVQNLSTLDAGLGGMKVTINKFYLPKGASNQLRGVSSDIYLPSLLDHYDVGEKFYDSPLKWDQVAPTEHANFDLVSPYITKLNLASAARVKNSKKFNEIEEAINKFKQEKKTRLSISLKSKVSDEKKDAKSEKTEPKLHKGGRQSTASASESKKVDVKTTLENDPHLEEAILIAADYARLMGKKDIARLRITGMLDSKNLTAKQSRMPQKANDSKK